MLNIATIDYELLVDNVLNTTIDGEETILDADLVIVNPGGFERLWTQKTFRGLDTQLSIRSPDSDLLVGTFYQRKNEIQTLLQNGKIIIVFLSPLATLNCEKMNSNAFQGFSNYDFLPINGFLGFYLRNGKSGKSNSIKLVDLQNPFANYYKAFKDSLNYHAYLDIISGDKDLKFLLVNNSHRPVGFTYKIEKGLLVFLPLPNYNKANEKLVAVLKSCAEPFLFGREITPPPEWLSKFQLRGEAEIDSQIEILTSEISKLEQKKVGLEGDKSEIEKYKKLLYEKGIELEKVVISAFQLLGFDAKNRRINDLEHDMVFESEEGKGIAEVEGKDNDALNISKLDQLTRAVDEDFELTGNYAQGILIGNHYRLVNPEDRKAPFTDKVLISAKRKNFGLLTSQELFRAVSDVFREPGDDELKKRYREKILKTAGEEIKLL
jgi:hypothetical protein